MSFDDLLDRAVALLDKRGRITYRSLQRELELDDGLLEDLKHELIVGLRVAVDEDGLVLVRAGGDAPERARPTEHPSAEGEIKHVTVMFCDLVRSTELVDRIGAEEMHDLLNSFFGLSLEVIHTYGGTINQFLGDGFMALFGAPISYEDHARRAVRATVQLRETLKENRSALGGDGAELLVRFGVNTGKVVVGGIGDNLRMDYTAVGDTSNVASRLQSMADPGEILISESVASHVRSDTNLEALPPRAVKGKSELIAAYRVLDVRQRHAGPMDLEEGRELSPFVGRDDELRRMLEIAGRMEEGHGHVIALRADAGVGKSRLTHEFRKQIVQAGTAFVEGRCVSFEHTTPYRPLIDMVRDVAGITDADAPEATVSKLQAYLESRSLPSEEWTPYMVRLFGLESSSKQLDTLSPEAVKARTFKMFRMLAEHASRLRPLVIFIEDLHWIDSASEGCLAQMIEVASENPVLFVLTYRPTYKAPWLDRSSVTHLDLRRLPSEDGRALVHAVVGQLILPEAVLETILEKAEGVPFFMEELTRAVLESGDMDGDAAVPATIEGVITSRIDRLPDLTKRLLHTAAVLGRRFTAELLREIWSEGSGVDPLLQELSELAFIRQEEGALEPSYVFSHALTQDVAYGCILKSRRRSIHAAAGAALERLYEGRVDEALDRLAHHFSHTGNAEKAVHYLRSFAQQAAQSYSHAEAARALQMALGHVEGLDESGRDATHFVICDELCNSLYFLGRFEDTIDLLEGCQPLLDRVDDAGSAAIFHFWMGHTCSYVGRMPEAFDHAGKAIEHAQRSGDKLTEGRAAYVMERASFWTGKFPDAIRYGEQAIAALASSGARWWEAQSLWMIGWSHGAMGEFDEALAAEERTRALGAEIQDPRLPCYAAWTSAALLAMRGDMEDAIAEGLRGLERSPDLLNTGVAWGFTGFAYLEAGEVEEAVSLLQKGAERMLEMRFRPLHGWFTIWWGEAHLLRGESDRAEELVRQGMTVCQEVDNLWGVGMAQRALGRIGLAHGDLDDAARHLEDAAGTFAPICASYWTARVHLDNAEVAQGRGAATEVSTELTQARAAFSYLRCEHWVKETEEFARIHDVTMGVVSA